MAGIPTVPDTNGRQVIDSQTLGRTEGTTAQNWAGPTMQANSSSLGNSGNQNLTQSNAGPQDASGRAGYLAAGQPAGNPQLAPHIPGGQYDTHNDVEQFFDPAPAAKGGLSNWANPVFANQAGWTVQGDPISGLPEDNEDLELNIYQYSPPAATSTTSAYAGYTFASLDPTTNSPSFTWSAPNGMPDGMTLSSGGAMSGTPTATGTFTFLIEVVNATGLHADRWVTWSVT